MTDKIAIHVPTWDDYLRLGVDDGRGIDRSMWCIHNVNTCITFSAEFGWQYGYKRSFAESGYTIYTVDQYLESRGELKEKLVNLVNATQNLEYVANAALEAAKEKQQELPKTEDTKYNDGVIGDTNPKRQFGLASIPLHLWSPLASAYGSLGLYNGSLKYGRNNFKATPVEASIYIAAAMRHLNAWAEGEEYDPADGVPNLGGVLANIAILLEARAAGTLVDDRQMGTGYLKEREHLKEIMKNVTEIHKDKNPRHYTIADNPKEKDND